MCIRDSVKTEPYTSQISLRDNLCSIFKPVSWQCPPVLFKFFFEITDNLPRNIMRQRNIWALCKIKIRPPHPIVSVGSGNGRELNNDSEGKGDDVKCLRIKLRDCLNFLENGLRGFKHFFKSWIGFGTLFQKLNVLILKLWNKSKTLKHVWHKWSIDVDNEKNHRPVGGASRILPPPAQCVVRGD